MEFDDNDLINIEFALITTITALENDKFIINKNGRIERLNVLLEKVRKI